MTPFHGTTLAPSLSSTQLPVDKRPMKRVNQMAKFPLGPGRGPAAVGSEKGPSVTSPPPSHPEEDRCQGKHVNVESFG